MGGGYCSQDQLGRFILNLPSGKTANETSFWSARVELTAGKPTLTPSSIPASSGLWANPNGTLPNVTKSEYDSPWRRRGEEHEEVYIYEQPIHYPVHKTGYYCVG